MPCKSDELGERTISEGKTMETGEVVCSTITVYLVLAVHSDFVCSTSYTDFKTLNRNLSSMAHIRPVSISTSSLNISRKVTSDETRREAD